RSSFQSPYPLVQSALVRRTKSVSARRRKKVLVALATGGDHAGGLCDPRPPTVGRLQTHRLDSPNRAYPHRPRESCGPVKSRGMAAHRMVWTRRTSDTDGGLYC